MRLYYYISILNENRGQSQEYFQIFFDFKIDAPHWLSPLLLNEASYYLYDK